MNESGKDRNPICNNDDTICHIVGYLSLSVICHMVRNSTITNRCVGLTPDPSTIAHFTAELWRCRKFDRKKNRNPWHARVALLLEATSSPRFDWYVEILFVGRKSVYRADTRPFPYLKGSGYARLLGLRSCPTLVADLQRGVATIPRKRTGKDRMNSEYYSMEWNKYCL